MTIQITLPQCPACNARMSNLRWVEVISTSCKLNLWDYDHYRAGFKCGLEVRLDTQGLIAMQKWDVFHGCPKAMELLRKAGGGDDI